MPPGVSRKHLRHRKSSSTPAKSPKTGSGCPPHPTPAFSQKSRQAIENKRWECANERKERKRVRKQLKTKGHLGGQALRESEGCGYTLGCGGKERRNGDTVSKTLTWILPHLLLLVAIFVQDLKEEENITFSSTKAHSQSTFTVAVAMQPILISSQMRSDDWTTSRSE